MKARSLVAVPLFALTALAARGDEWMNFIFQRQVDTGVVWQMPVDPRGESPSQLPLDEGGALFQLWTINRETAKDYLLDQKLVGAYIPSAEIRIETGDPYPHVNRTRADQPFTVRIGVAGLLSGHDLPRAATEVMLEHFLAPYPEGRTSVDPEEVIGGTPHSHGFIDENGTTRLPVTASQLPASDPTKALGEEHFVIHALSDGDAPQTQLASDFVQIWPVADAAIGGIEPGSTLRGTVPALTVDLRDLYPSSMTYLQLYEGEPKLGTEGVRVTGGTLVLDQDTSEDRVLRIDKWGHLLENDGPHTLEIVTVTPFGTERLTYVAFEIDRSLRVNAQLGSAETDQSRRSR